MYALGADASQYNYTLDQFQSLQQSGQSPVCLFPMQRVQHSCLRGWNLVVSRFSACMDKINEMTGAEKWCKRAVTKLDRLDKKDCNLTTGLETVLHIAVGARVMLQQNLDTKCGLVNDAIGTITYIGTSYIHEGQISLNMPLTSTRLRR